MSFKLRFSILFSLSVLVILAASAVYIYLLNEDLRRSDFHARLHAEATRASMLYFRHGQSTPQNLSQMAAVLTSVPDEQVVILDQSLNVLFSNVKEYRQPLNNDIFSKARREGSFFFPHYKHEMAAVYLNHPVPHYILSSGYDRYGLRKSRNLLLILVISVLGGLLLAGFVAFLFVQEILKPLNRMRARMTQINEQNLTERLPLGPAQDELTLIAKSFNDMLGRLEKAFETRKNFVQHASHELRTPLANMLSQTEAALSRDIDKEQYRQVLQSLKEDQQEMISLTNSLLLLSQYESLTRVYDWKIVRIDELIDETIDITRNLYKDTVISVHFNEMPEDERFLQFRGNEMLLKSAFQNLVRNACLYSDDKQVNIVIAAGADTITIHFNNRGNQLRPDEQGRLFIPFFRGDNSTNKKGFGLGLSIALRIFELHGGSLRYEALENSINCFVINLPHSKD